MCIAVYVLRVQNCKGEEEKMQPTSRTHWDEGEESSSSSRSSAQNFGLKLDFLSEDSSSSVAQELVCRDCKRTTVVPGSQFFSDEGRINNSSSRISSRFNNSNSINEEGEMSRFSTLDEGRVSY